MKTYRHSKGSIFLLEIVINLIIFSVLVIVSLQFIIKTHNLTKTTTQLHYGITQCSNVASLYERSNGEIESLQEFFPLSTFHNDKLMIYFNENYKECDRDSSVSSIKVSYSAASTDEVPTVSIKFKYMEKEICSLNAASHSPNSISSREDD